MKKSPDTRIGNLFDTSLKLLYLMGCHFILQITYLCFNLSGSYGFTTHTHSNIILIEQSTYLCLNLCGPYGFTTHIRHPNAIFIQQTTYLSFNLSGSYGFTIHTHSNVILIQQSTYLFFNHSGSYGFTTHTYPLALSFNKVHICASTFVVHKP